MHLSLIIFYLKNKKEKMNLKKCLYSQERTDHLKRKNTENNAFHRHSMNYFLESVPLTCFHSFTKQIDTNISFISFKFKELFYSNLYSCCHKSTITRVTMCDSFIRICGFRNSILRSLK